MRSLLPLLLAGCAATPSPAPAGPVEQRIPGTSVTLRLLPVPADAPRFWIGETEVPWEAYDAFVYRFDEEDPDLPPGVDALARPSRPYITMDRGYGHAGNPAISMSFAGARAFCEWLSTHTGRRFRLPTEEEWALAAGAGSPGWTRENSEGRTHRVARLAANEHGLHDVIGNAAEWCVGADGHGVLRGGHFRAEGCTPAWRAKDDPTWNRSDPQLPKSVWWLADAPFAGLRILLEP